MKNKKKNKEMIFFFFKLLDFLIGNLLRRFKKKTLKSSLGFKYCKTGFGVEKKITIPFVKKKNGN